MLADQPDQQDQPFMSIPEAAARLDVGASSVRRWVKTGRLRAIRLPSGTARIRRADVEAILNGDQPEAVAS